VTGRWEDDTLGMPTPVSDLHRELTKTERRCFIGLVAIIMLAAALALVPSAEARQCLPRTITAKHAPTTALQRANVTAALDRAWAIGTTRKQQVALVAAATQEQKLENLPHGHGTSVGFLQLTDHHFGGSVRKRMRIYNSSGWFVNGAKQVDRPHLSPGQLAQRVQRSAHPYAYQRWVGEARRTVNAYRASCR
jgi:hypothetical protein